jgi:RimJ/RimL family protein N-acetyltransferase
MISTKNACEMAEALEGVSVKDHFATEGAKGALQYGFNNLGLKEIVSFTTVKNLRSRRVMEKIGMWHDSKGDFEHPKLAADCPVRPHVLYRIGPHNGSLSN